MLRILLCYQKLKNILMRHYLKNSFILMTLPKHLRNFWMSNRPFALAGTCLHSQYMTSVSPN